MLELERRPSTVHGQGVFTRVPIPAGCPVITFGGPTLGGCELQPDMRVMQIGPDTYIAEDVEADYIENYVNHRCEPNLGFTHGTLTLHALRRIEAGEELFWDYSTSINDPGWSVPCRCGAADCRGEIRSFCDLSPTVAARLRPISLAYLRQLP